MSKVRLFGFGEDLVLTLSLLFVRRKLPRETGSILLKAHGTGTVLIPSSDAHSFDEGHINEEPSRPLHLGAVNVQSTFAHSSGGAQKFHFLA